MYANCALPLLLLYSLIQQTISVCSAPTPYTYNSNCYEQCPWIPPSLTYLDGTTCVTDCGSKYQDDYTRQCVTTCPTSPILTFKDDNQNRCVQMCSTNPSQFADLAANKCVQYCTGTTWADSDTRHCVATCPSGTYQQISGSHRVCTSRCYANFYADLSKRCVAAASCPSTPVAYYGDDSTNKCVTQCPYDKGTFAQQSTRKCVYFCTLGTFADSVDRKCVSECPVGPPVYYGSNVTRQCHLQCIQGQFADSLVRQCVDECTLGTFGDYQSRKCVQLCPQSDDTYADPLTRLCIAVCSPGYFADEDLRACVPSTDCSRDLVGDPVNLLCVDPLDCPIGYFVDAVNKMCVRKCAPPYWANTDTRFCMLYCEWNPPAYTSFYDSSTRTCAEECSSNPRSFAHNITQICETTCPTGYFGSILTYQCVRTCPDGYHSNQDSNLCVSECTSSDALILYFFTPNVSCISACPQGYYADNMTVSCVETCPQDTYAYQTNNTCLSGCPGGYFADHHSQQCVQQCSRITSYYADDSTNKCVHICPVVPDYYGEDLNDAHLKCVSSCTSTNHYADPITRTCVLKCNVTQGYFGYDSDKRCYLNCPVGWGNPLTTKCVATCPQSPIQMFGDNLTATCVQKCPNTTYGDKSIQVCVNATDCPSGYFADDKTGLCVNRCSELLKLFGDPVTKKCVLSCQHPYYSDNTTRKCETTCNATAKLYKDPSTKQCVNLCPQMPDLYAELSTKTCVGVCSSGYAVAYNTTVTKTRKCVTMCPSSPVFYADEQNKKCVTTCANRTYKFVNNTYRGCLNTCPPQVFNATNIVDLYTDNTTWKCVSLCPLNRFAFKHPTIATIRDCVPICHKVGSVYYFSENNTRKCVTQCPFFMYKTYGDKINFQCVYNCSRDQFRDNTTKLCTYECSNDFFADNSTYMCVKDCPIGTFAESINKTCVLYCPTDYFAYTLTRKCVQTCDHWRYYANNISWLCIQQCSAIPDYYQDPVSKQCVDKCPNGRYAEQNGRKCAIAKNCHNGRVADPTTNRCVDRCPSDPMYFVQPSTNLCGPICNEGLFADNSTNKCVSVCPSPYYGVNSITNFICVQYCPATQYKHVSDTARICLTDCPDGYFADDLTMSCVQICPDYYYGNQADKKCIEDCQPLYADDITKQCVDICPIGTTASNNSYKCQQQCDYGQYQFEKVCHSSCDPDYFADNLTRKCILQCPNDPFTFADPINHLCVFSCPTDHYALSSDRTCVEQCPDALFKQLTLKLCIYPCLDGSYADPITKSCLSDCSDAVYTFIQPFIQSCVDVCPEDPDLYGLNNQKCVEHCPTGMFAENFTRLCVTICPNVSAVYLNESWADDLTHRCVRRCSALSYAHINETHNVCVNSCPDDLFASQILQACVAQCPSDTFAHNDSNTCVYHCPNGQFADLNSKICMDRCDHYEQLFMDNSTNTCVEQCPSIPSLFSQISTMQCVFSCQINFYALLETRQCQADCPDPYFQDSTSGRCVQQCPIHQQTFGDSILRQCTSGCVNHTINSVETIFYADKSISLCVQVCSASNQKLFGYNASNICEQTCPQGTYGDDDTRLCLDKCVFQFPKYTWMDEIDNFCVTLCPQGYYADNTTQFCESQCSSGLFADYSSRRCVVTCPVIPALYGHVDTKTCISLCPSGLFADQSIRVCVARCPIVPNVYYHYTPTQKCVLQCLYPYYAQVQSQNCVQICQDGFYGNLTTHKCQICKPECVTCTAYLQCTSCITNYYRHLFSCVLTCPSYPVKFYAHIDNGACFQICPEPYFGQTNTGLCQLSCQVRYYGNMNTRVCTQCPTGCLTCDINGCYTCLENYTYVEPTLKCSHQCNLTHTYFFNDLCYVSCPDASYLSIIDLVTCLLCNEECATCSGSASNCTTCAYKFYYQGGCVDKCPSNFFVNDQMICVSCVIYPSKCTLAPLSYTIHPFTKNYKQHAYVVFNRVVNLTLARFQQIVQIKYNGKTVSPNQFTTIIYNTTTYEITFTSLTSLNQNSLSIGFQPGTIVDYSGNHLTVNYAQSQYITDSGVTQEIAQTSQTVIKTASAVGWVILGIVLLFLIKSGYPFLIALECVQFYYMLIFIKLEPIPYLQLTFLDALKNVNLLFLPTFFPDLSQTTDNYAIPQYQSFLTNTSFLYNCSPLIVVFGFVLFVYLLFLILSRKSIIGNKKVRQISHRIRKYRLKFMIINDAFWFTYFYAIFMATLQFTQASIQSIWDIINIVLAAIVFLSFLIYTVWVLYLGNKYKQQKPPRKYAFLKLQESSFPMQMPLRYVRKLLVCLSLLLPSIDAQCILLIVAVSIFLLYLVCFMPSQSLVTNLVNITIEISYIVLIALFYGYDKMDDKNIDVQLGFSITMITIQCLVLCLVVIWIIYRGILVIRGTSTWKNVYKRATNNQDPQYLRQQQHKRDLQFDLGSLENRTFNGQKDTDENGSTRNIKLGNQITEKFNIFQVQKDDEPDTQHLHEQQSANYFNEQKNQRQISSSFGGSRRSEQKIIFQPSKTQQIKKRRNKKDNLEIRENDDLDGLDIIELDDHPQNTYKKKPIVHQKQSQKKQVKAIWDDIEFDDNEI